jgi:hypothetical protein
MLLLEVIENAGDNLIKFLQGESWPTSDKFASNHALAPMIV